MEHLTTYSLIFLLGILGTTFILGKQWSSTFTNFLFANRSLRIAESSLAICSHWFFAIAMFVGPAVAYKWGLYGLIWFVIPNALSIAVVGLISYKIRNKYPDGYSLTKYIQDNFSKRLSGLYQLDFILVSFYAILLAFIAIEKFWAFAGINSIAPYYATLAVGVITLVFTMRGGIRTSVFSGAFQSAAWVIFFVTCAIIGMNATDNGIFTLGQNNLESVLDWKFLTTFGITYVITMIVGATSHGMMWQKAFSMPRENIIPSYLTASAVFAVIVFFLGSLSLLAFSNGIAITSPDFATLTSIGTYVGVGGLLIFGILLIGQASTVIDSALNYIASLGSIDWTHKESVGVSRLFMFGFLIAVWLVSWLKIDIWTLFVLMSAVRATMFVPLVLHALDRKLSENWIFYSSILGIASALYFSIQSKMTKTPEFDLYAMLCGLGIPLIGYLLSRKFSKD
jgi:Na+/proline symporter